MNINKIAMATALLLSTGAAHSVAIKSLDITGGSFVLADQVNALNPAAFATMTMGSYQGSVPGPVRLTNEAFYAPTSIVTATFGDYGPIAVYTAETDGVRSGFAAPTGDITDNILSLDLSSWTMYWNGVTPNFGSSSDFISDPECTGSSCTTAIITTYDELSGGFTASWDAVWVGGACNGCPSSWSITGTVIPTPVPAAAWLFGSGLIGLIGLARKTPRS